MPKDRDPHENSALSRRAVLVGAGALASVAASRAAWAAGEHDHSKHAPKRPKLLEALEDCTSTGRLCISHCLVTFGEGDTSLAACAARVHEMVAVCAAMETLVASNSAYVNGMTKVCAEACEDCSAACREHAEKHKECRACMEACDALLSQLKKLAA